MAMNIAFTEKLDILDADLSNSTATDTDLDSEFVDISQYNRVRVIGGIAAATGCTLTVSIVEATDTAGTAPVVVATTTLYLPLGIDRDAVCICEARTDLFTVGSDFAAGRVSQDSGGAEDLDVILIGGEPVEKPVDDGEGWYSGTLTSA